MSGKVTIFSVNRSNSVNIFTQIRHIQYIFAPFDLSFKKNIVFLQTKQLKTMNMNPTGLMADNGYSYPSTAELRNIFASSCVEAAARRLQMPAVEMYRKMKRVELFRDVIYPCYDTLHTQSREIVTEDVLKALKIREEKMK